LLRRVFLRARLKRRFRWISARFKARSVQYVFLMILCPGPRGYSKGVPVLKRTRLGLQYSLIVQYSGLRLSAAMYDAGHQTEAIRIANALFVLLGPDMRNHKSILAQLGAINDQFTIPSTADSRGPHGTALIAVEAVPYTKGDGTGGWVIDSIPFGHEALNGGRRLQVADWWSEGVLSGIGATATITRLEVTRIMRDQDGGAHLDDHIKDETYLAVYRKGAGFLYKPRADSEESLPVEGALGATVRQMAHEVLSVVRGYAISAQVSLADAAKNGPLPPQYFEIGSNGEIA
jgi:hypothetical protein